MTVYHLTDGVTSTGIPLHSGDEMLVSSGGIAIATAVSSGGQEIIYVGGRASFTTVSNSGFELVSSGGAASFTTVSNGGAEVVSGGGSAISTTVSSGGTETVSSGGMTNFTAVSSGGYEIVSKGGVASFTTISFGGTEDVSSGGTTSFATVSGGTEYVYSGGTASFTVDLSDVVLSGGTAIDTTVGFAGLQHVSAGGRAISTALENGGGEVVGAGGTASFTTVSSGGQGVDSGGTTFGTTLLTGGSTEYVYSGGRSVSTTVSGTGPNGGEYLLESATASDTTLNDGGIEVVGPHARAISTTVNSGGVEVVSSGAGPHNTVLNSGGAIDVSYMPFVAGGSVSVNSSGLLTVSVGGRTYTQQLAGEYARVYGLSPDTAYYGGTDITAEAPCFRGGTRIMTNRGDVAVEDLAVGDLVQTVLGGSAAPIVWIGHRQVDCAHHPKPRQIWPIRVAAGAFGPGQPHTELFLSPDHAVYVNHVLIPVKHLINGSTIAQVPVERVTFYHIELPRHDVLLAEGLPAESFLDMRDGSNYANRSGPVRLYPDFSVRMWEAFGCARLVLTGPEVVAVRALVGRFASERVAA